MINTYTHPRLQCRKKKKKKVYKDYDDTIPIDRGRDKIDFQRIPTDVERNNIITASFRFNTFQIWITQTAVSQTNEMKQIRHLKTTKIERLFNCRIHFFFFFHRSSNTHVKYDEQSRVSVAID